MVMEGAQNTHMWVGQGALPAQGCPTWSFLPLRLQGSWVLPTPSLLARATGQPLYSQIAVHHPWASPQNSALNVSWKRTRNYCASCLQLNSSWPLLRGWQMAAGKAPSLLSGPWGLRNKRHLQRALCVSWPLSVGMGVHVEAWPAEAKPGRGAW